VRPVRAGGHSVDRCVQGLCSTEVAAVEEARTGNDVRSRNAHLDSPPFFTDLPVFSAGVSVLSSSFSDQTTRPWSLRDSYSASGTSSSLSGWKLVLIFTATPFLWSLGPIETPRENLVAL